MAIALTVLDVDPGVTLLWVRLKAALSGSYTTGGDSMDFTTLAGQVGAFGQAVNSQQLPQAMFARSRTGNVANQYIPFEESAPGVGLAVNALKMKVLTAFGTELAAGAYPAGVTGDDIEIVCAFRKLQ
jgi:hypothetical protein